MTTTRYETLTTIQQALAAGRPVWVDRHWGVVLDVEPQDLTLWSPVRDELAEWVKIKLRDYPDTNVGRHCRTATLVLRDTIRTPTDDIWRRVLCCEVDGTATSYEWANCPWPPQDRDVYAAPATKAQLAKHIDFLVNWAQDDRALNLLRLAMGRAAA